MPNTLILSDWAALGDDAQDVRIEVFVTEQKVPIELEIDEMDALSLHAVVYNDTGEAVGTGRLLPDGHIGRMAVKRHCRHLGIGGQLLQSLMRAAQDRGDVLVVLNAQMRAVGFYERFGFACEGEQFDDAGIPHVLMQHTFPN